MRASIIVHLCFVVAGATRHEGHGRRAELAFYAKNFKREVPGFSDVTAALSPAPAHGRSLAGFVPHSGLNLSSIVSVLDFGAVPDGTTDNTAAFNAALKSLAPSGGIVFVPAGQWAFTGSIVMTTATSLVGTFETIASHSHDGPPSTGSVLLPSGGRGTEQGAFINMTEDCTVRGFTIYYPGNLPTVSPVAYPWSIAMQGDNNAVQDVELLNSWNGIYAVLAARHYIARVQGQPINIGIFVDSCYDIGRIEDVHWNPWYSDDAAYILHQTTQGIGFLIARTDWEYFSGTFVFAMSIGYKFIESSTGACNGVMINPGADCCANASVLVADMDPWGLSIVNGEFTSFSGSFGPDIADHTQIVVAPTNTGALRITNSAFWGPSNQIANISGTGSVGFDDCIFNEWNSTRAALQVFGGDILVRGSDFQSANPMKIHLNVGTGKAIVAHNVMTGSMGITNDVTNSTRFVINDNVADSP